MYEKLTRIRGGPKFTWDERHWNQTDQFSPDGFLFALTKKKEKTDTRTNKNLIENSIDVCAVPQSCAQRFNFLFSPLLCCCDWLCSQLSLAMHPCAGSYYYSTRWGRAPITYSFGTLMDLFLYLTLSLIFLPSLFPIVHLYCSSTVMMTSRS